MRRHRVCPTPSVPSRALLIGSTLLIIIASNRSASAWFGGGPAVIMTDPEVRDSHTDLGLNVLTGVSGTRGSVRPFGQLRGVFGEDGQVVLSGGVRF